MLTKDFKESTSLQSVGSLELPLPDDDLDALLILLNIIHAQTEEIPLEVDLYCLHELHSWSTSIDYEE